MVEYLLREQEGAGSNPVIPTMNDKGTSIEAVFVFSGSGSGSESHPCIVVLKIQTDSFVNYISPNCGGSFRGTDYLSFSCFD